MDRYIKILKTFKHGSGKTFQEGTYLKVDDKTKSGNTTYLREGKMSGDCIKSERWDDKEIELMPEGFDPKNIELTPLLYF